MRFLMIVARWGILSFALEFFLAPGACNENFSLASRNPDGLTAFRANKIAVVPVSDSVQHQTEAAVFLVALIDVSGKTPPNCPDHQPVAHRPGSKTDGSAPEEGGNQTGEKTTAENDDIQSVSAISPGHKPTKSQYQFPGKITEPAAEIVHGITLINGMKKNGYIIFSFSGNFNREWLIFTECLIFV